ncbi:DUF3592 domain-containing protein [Streptomyces axinellae]|uniref:DUF3592 domain-containing protein n=1 Tax=Streptomyces axinellae TaxID=552788 RepID=UPI0031CFFE9E
MLFLLIGPVIIGFGVREAAHQRRLRSQGIRTEGRVVRHRRKSGNEGPVSFAVVNFVDTQGSPREFQHRASGVKGLPVGGHVPVLYLPGAPESARLDLSAKRFQTVGMPFAGGLGFMAIAVWMLSTAH